MSKLSQPQRVAAVSMIVVAVSAFLPWVSVLGLSVSGINGDGQLTLIASVAGLVVLAAHTGVISTRISRRVMLIVSGIGAALAAAVGLYDMNGYAAIGLYLTLFGGLAWVVAVIWDVRTGRAAASIPAAEGSVVAVSERVVENDRSKIKCPDCAEQVDAEANVCRWCGHVFRAEQPAQA